MELHHALLPTLAGPLLAVADGEGLRHLHLLGEADSWRIRLAESVSAITLTEDDDLILLEDPARFDALAQQLGEYFTGRRTAFDLELSPHGTNFQQRVWIRLCAIPYGDLRTYSQIARELDEPRAARAVGQAAAQNPLPILIPCHRLLGTRGNLMGFAGGTDLKARLLRLEGHTLAAGERVRPPRLF